MLTRVQFSVEIGISNQVGLIAKTRGISEGAVWREIVDAGFRSINGRAQVTAEDIEKLSDALQLTQRVVIETLCLSRRSIANQGDDLFKLAREDSVAMIKDLVS